MDQNEWLNRKTSIFASDIEKNFQKLSDLVEEKKFLIVGGAGTIGQSVTEQLVKFCPKTLDVIDLSENNLVELVRTIRSGMSSPNANFKAVPLDVNSLEFDRFIEKNGPYDYVLNLSALKHVRSEKDAFSLSRMIDVNIFNSVKLAKLCLEMNAKKYFCVSTDKAANPANMMGASKRIMELFLMRESEMVDISFARFANVLFSDGSLPFGFLKRFEKMQPLSAPFDVKRYFITKEESGQLCMLSCLLGKNRDIFFPKLKKNLHETTFSDLAEKFLLARGFKPVIYETEDGARQEANAIIPQKKWPVYFFASDTTGEKDYEEFFTDDEDIDMKSYKMIGIVKAREMHEKDKLDYFSYSIEKWRENKSWDKESLVKIFKDCLPEFKHEEKNKNLDQKM